MARIVVTGGAGFLGSHLCRALLDRGDEVVAIDNLLTGSVANIEDLFGRRGFTFVEADVSSYVWVPGHLDVVMHLASPASPVDFERFPIQILKVGGLGTHNCLGLAKAKGALFFLASTSEVYGDPIVHPQPESYWGHVNPIGPRGVYDEAKRYAEAMTMAYHRHHGLDVRIVRIFNSVLSDEHVLYDDGAELRREPVGALAARVGDNAPLAGYTVPAFDSRGAVRAAAAVALVGHPPSGPCFEVRTGYGRSVRVTGDHSLFVEGERGEPVARPVSQLAVGDRVAIAGRISVPERDRAAVSVVEVWDRLGEGPWGLELSWPGLGGVLWQAREDLVGFLRSRKSCEHGPSGAWERIARNREADAASLAELRRLGLAIPWELAVARLAGGGPHQQSLPAAVQITDELLGVLGLWLAGGDAEARPGSGADGSIVIRAPPAEIDAAAKVLERDLGWRLARAPSSGGGARARLVVRSQLAAMLLEHLGFGAGRKRIPGWVLGLPLSRLKWFIDGYRRAGRARREPQPRRGAGPRPEGRHVFHASHEELKDDLVVALGRFGVCPSVSRRWAGSGAGRRQLSWRVEVSKVSPWSPLEWDRGVDQALVSPRWGDLVWAPVRAVTPVPATGLVYDFCVPGRENFLAGGGVMAHNTYGPLMRPDDGRAVSNFLVQALRGEPLTVFGDGRQTRSFTYVDDEIAGMLALLDSRLTLPVNIGNPEEVSIRRLAELCIEVTGSSSEIVCRPLPVDDPARRQPDIALARRELGWAPAVGLREGLERTAAYFRRRLGIDAAGRPRP